MDILSVSNTIFPPFGDSILVAPSKAFASSELRIILQAIIDQLVLSNIYTVNQIAITIKPNYQETFPIVDTPFVIIYIGDMHNLPEEDGGGRFCKGWTGNITIAPIVRNFMNYQYLDSSVTLETNSDLGVIQKTQDIIKVMEQVFPYDSFGNLVLRELPIAKILTVPFRYGKSYEYVTMPIDFEISWNQNLPSDLP